MTESRSRATAGAGLEAFDFQVDNILNDGGNGDDEDDEEQNPRSMIGQVQVKINGLHVRFEEDYFSAEKPYSIGLTASSFELQSAQPGQEVWQFPDFLQNIFNTVSAADSDNTKLGDLIFKNVSVKNLRMYVNTPSEIFIPTLVYDESKHLPK